MYIYMWDGQCGGVGVLFVIFRVCCHGPYASMYVCVFSVLVSSPCRICTVCKHVAEGGSLILWYPEVFYKLSISKLREVLFHQEVCNICKTCSCMGKYRLEVFIGACAVLRTIYRAYVDIDSSNWQ